MPCLWLETHEFPHFTTHSIANRHLQVKFLCFKLYHRPHGIFCLFTFKLHHDSRRGGKREVKRIFFYSSRRQSLEMQKNESEVSDNILEFLSVCFFITYYMSLIHLSREGKKCIQRRRQTIFSMRNCISNFTIENHVKDNPMIFFMNAPQQNNVIKKISIQFNFNWKPS